MAGPSSPERPDQQNAGGHAAAEATLGTVGVSKRTAGVVESRLASRLWWDADADDYHREHGDFLGVSDFVWCPEGLRESEAGLDRKSVV